MLDCDSVLVCARALGTMFDMQHLHAFDVHTYIAVSMYLYLNGYIGGTHVSLCQSALEHEHEHFAVQ